MDNVKNDQYYISKVMRDIDFIMCHTQDVSIEDLNANEVLLDSMLFRMIQISENSRKISDEYKLTNKKISWNELYGLRNRIVHDYGNVDINIIYETLKNDIPELFQLLSK